jgi:hypothetical protein
MDEDGFIAEDSCWECIVWENGIDADAHNAVEFASEALARMYIQFNGWTEQVL